MENQLEKLAKSKAAVPVELVTAGVLVIAIVAIGSRVADLVLTVMACGVSYLAGRFRR